MDDKIEWMVEQVEDAGWASENLEADVLLYIEDINLALDKFVREFFDLLVELEMAWEEAE